MSAIEPLLKRKLFASEEEAISRLVSDYVLRQISEKQRELSAFERKYGMSFEQFGEYLHERSRLMSEGALTKEQRAALGQAVMQEEDDWLDWKVAKEILERCGETWTKSNS
jgi:hypothetical protein